MTTRIICLANSKKFSERCVAGIEVVKNDKSYSILSSNSAPKWLRPITDSDHGEFPASIAKDLNLLDIIEFDIIEPCPSGYQSENVYFAEESVKKISQIRLSRENLDSLTHDTTDLFGNKGKAVHEDVIDTINHSLIFIKVTEHNVFIKPENDQLRMKFIYNSLEYDLPITDIKFETNFRENDKILQDIEHIYLTISLAVAHNNWHSKLIAGIIYI
jgi:hypothetical protein